MKRLRDPHRYDNVPISEKTKKGMSLNSDDLQAIGRLLALQDDAYDEQFEQIFAKLEIIEKKLENHESRICILERKLEEHLRDHK